MTRNLKSETLFGKDPYKVNRDKMDKVGPC